MSNKVSIKLAFSRRLVEGGSEFKDPIDIKLVDDSLDIQPRQVGVVEETLLPSDWGAVQSIALFDGATVGGRIKFRAVMESNAAITELELAKYFRLPVRVYSEVITGYFILPKQGSIIIPDFFVESTKPTSIINNRLSVVEVTLKEFPTGGRNYG